MSFGWMNSSDFYVCFWMILCHIKIDVFAKMSTRRWNISQFEENDEAFRLTARDVCFFRRRCPVVMIHSANLTTLTTPVMNVES